MFIKRIVIGSVCSGFIATGIWVVINHTKKIRNRNWGNGLIKDLNDYIEQHEKNGDAAKAWDLEGMKWDSEWFKKQYDSDGNQNIKNKWASWEEARYAFFKEVEKAKNNNKLKDLLGPTSYSQNFSNSLQEFMKVKPYQAKKK